VGSEKDKGEKEMCTFPQVSQVNSLAPRVRRGRRSAAEGSCGTEREVREGAGMVGWMGRLELKESQGGNKARRPMSVRSRGAAIGTMTMWGRREAGGVEGTKVGFVLGEEKAGKAGKADRRGWMSSPVAGWLG
jgi:hypothetical protein